MHGFHANWRSLAETSILQFTFALAHQTRISHLNDTLTTAAEFPKTVDAFRSGTLTCRTSQTFSCNDQPPPYKRSMAMYVPVRPTPALQWTIKGFSRFVLPFRTALRNPSNSLVVRGAPWSGHDMYAYCLMVRDSLPQRTLKTRRA
eukprot:m.950256 g.950256  ORF g.950256 m.950256 type:complete len:146 (-) comp23859_c0_seq9:2276-2713(-)